MPRAPQARRKMYVLDTNVLIHDPNALLNFEEHDVIIRCPSSKSSTA